MLKSAPLVSRASDSLGRARLSLVAAIFLVPVPAGGLECRPGRIASRFRRGKGGAFAPLDDMRGPRGLCRAPEWISILLPRLHGTRGVLGVRCLWSSPRLPFLRRPFFLSGRLCHALRGEYPKQEHDEHPDEEDSGRLHLRPHVVLHRLPLRLRGEPRQRRFCRARAPRLSCFGEQP